MPTINPSNFTAQITKTVTPADLGFHSSFEVPAGYRLIGFGEFNKFRVSQNDPSRYYINLPTQGVPCTLIPKEIFGRNSTLYPSSYGFIFEKEPRIRVIFEPIGAPPKIGEYYKSSQESWRFVQRENPLDDGYKNDIGYTRREETY